MRQSAVFTTLAFGLLVASALHAEETLPPLTGRPAPTTVDELWADFDPRREPLETEVLKEWEEDGVILRVVRFRIGVFKGRPARLAAVYGFPKGGTKLPALLQIHGGGQYAHHYAPLLNAKRGYATISIAWAGRISAPGYMVNSDVVKLFWENATDDPRYRVTTDWGALDGYHAPGRHEGNVFPSLPVAEWTLDPVESPRNCGWFLCALAARRALTFLERQPEVDPERLGVYGHSMGGKLTVMTAGSDDRVKAAAPSCGGVSDRDNRSALFRATLGDDAYLKRITCPTIFLSPANDFHGRIDDLQSAIGEIDTDDWRVTCSPHGNHQDLPEHTICGPLWFDQHLRHRFEFPATPESMLELETKDGVPTFVVRPDGSRPIRSVHVYYTQQGQLADEKYDHENTMARFWHNATAEQSGETWTARLPVFDLDEPVWVYANVEYVLKEPVTTAGYYYREETAHRFVLSSRMHTALPDQLHEAGVRATLEPTRTIESFEGDWRREWFTYRPEDWSLRTHKVYDPRWRAPVGARLAFEIRSEEPNTLVVGIDGYATEVTLAGGGEWQAVSLKAADFESAAAEPLPDWSGIRELRLGAAETLRPGRGEMTRPRRFGGPWKGPAPEFRQLEWLQAGSRRSDGQ